MDEGKFCERISSLAIKSILYEVAATPKPGLVDRENSGAHRDMDFYTFLTSASVLAPYFYRCAELGINFRGDDYRQLLLDIRPIGKLAEEDMFRATGGINTHKGIIFSQGIISAAAGSLYSQGEYFNIKNISLRVKDISQGISEELREAYGKKNKTYGEKLFIKYKTKGIREEVESGFKSVVGISYPIFKKLVEEDKYSLNDISIQTLLYLMKTIEDTNILGRHNMEILKFVQDRAAEALRLGGVFTSKGKEFIKSLDKIFIEKHISPGGSADLLAITHMIYMIEKAGRL